MDRPHILVVDDDQRLRELLKSFLTRQNFRVTAAGDAAEARERLDTMDFDLMVLDVMMPGQTGIEFAAELRARDHAIPILMLTAMGEPRDRVAGFESGVDDYLGKPFEPRELVLRIQSILRRVHAPPPAALPTDAVVTMGALRFDSGAGELTEAGGGRVRLTDTEVALLRALAARPGQTVDRETLIRLLGGDVNARTIDVQVTRLRRKIEPDPKFPRYLQTLRGAGYRLVGE